MNVKVIEVIRNVSKSPLSKNSTPRNGLISNHVTCISRTPSVLVVGVPLYKEDTSKYKETS